MSKETELKPCPFCGGKARTYDGPMDAYGVVCTKCGVKLYGRSSFGAAKRAWNRRTHNEYSETEEKRKAIQSECANQSGCDECPYTDGFCNYYSSDCAPPEIIDSWYEYMFGKKKDGE